jgi:hypothetical protein
MSVYWDNFAFTFIWYIFSETKVGNVLKPAVTLSSTSFNAPQFYILPADCVCVFLYGSQNKEHSMIGFYSRDD